jgi:hypothetical protein
MRHAERGERQESHHTRCHPDENSDHEGGLHGSPPLASDVINEPVARAKLGVARQRAPPFDEPARNIGGHCRHQDVDLRGQHLASEAGVLEKAIGSLIARHLHLGDHVNPEPGRITLGKAGVKEFDLLGNIREDRVELLVEHFEARERGIGKSTTTPDRAASSMRACRMASFRRIGRRDPFSKRPSVIAPPCPL